MADRVSFAYRAGRQVAKMALAIGVTFAPMAAAQAKAPAGPTASAPAAPTARSAMISKAQAAIDAAKAQLARMREVAAANAAISQSPSPRVYEVVTEEKPKISMWGTFRRALSWITGSAVALGLGAFISRITSPAGADDEAMRARAKLRARVDPPKAKGPAPVGPAPTPAEPNTTAPQLAKMAPAMPIVAKNDAEADKKAAEILAAWKKAIDANPAFQRTGPFDQTLYVWTNDTPKKPVFKATRAGSDYVSDITNDEHLRFTLATNAKVFGNNLTVTGTPEFVQAVEKIASTLGHDVTLNGKLIKYVKPEPTVHPDEALSQAEKQAILATNKALGAGRKQGPGHKLVKEDSAGNVTDKKSVQEVLIALSKNGDAEVAVLPGMVKVLPGATEKAYEWVALYTHKLGNPAPEIFADEPDNALHQAGVLRAQKALAEKLAKEATSKVIPVAAAKEAEVSPFDLSNRNAELDRLLREAQPKNLVVFGQAAQPGVKAPVMIEGTCVDLPLKEEVTVKLVMGMGKVLTIAPDASTEAYDKAASLIQEGKNFGQNIIVAGAGNSEMMAKLYEATTRLLDKQEAEQRETFVMTGRPLSEVQGILGLETSPAFSGQKAVDVIALPDNTVKPPVAKAVVPEKEYTLVDWLKQIDPTFNAGKAAPAANDLTKVKLGEHRRFKPANTPITKGERVPRMSGRRAVPTLTA